LEKFSGEVPAAVLSRPLTKCEPAWLADKLRLLFSAYRIDSYPDPKLFMAQVGMVMEKYDAQVVAIVTSPLTGIQRKCKFPPSIAEVVEECDRVRDEINAEARRRASPRIVFKPPERRDRPKPGEDYDSMVAKYGRPIGFFE
jgi:hypothetical protein